MLSILEIWYAAAETVITESLCGALWDDALTVKHSVLSISLHQYLAGHLCSFNVSEYKLDKATNIKLELLCICNWQILFWKHAWTWGSNLAFNIYIFFPMGKCLIHFQFTCCWFPDSLLIPRSWDILTIGEAINEIPDWSVWSICYGSIKG